MIFGLIGITIVYLIIIGFLIYGFDKVSDFHLQDKTAKTRFSILIPFRNESVHLPLLLASIKEFNYPKSLFEIIFINDASSDNSIDLINNFRRRNDFEIKILENIITSKSPKKDAIRIGIDHATAPWILTTDADCKLPKFWLDSFDSFIQDNQAELIVGPVCCYNSQSFLDRFQSLDFLGLQSSTIGGFGINQPFLCNGANLAYTKNFFKALNPYHNNDSIASGDDIFLLLEAKKKDASKIKFLKSSHALVETSSQNSWRKLFSQRLRWVSKSRHYKSVVPKIIGLVVFLMNLVLIIGLTMVLLNMLDRHLLFYCFVIKVSLDFLLIFKAARYFNKESILMSYIGSCLLYPFFVLIVGLSSVLGVYKWKDRSFRT